MPDPRGRGRTTNSASPSARPRSGTSARARVTTSSRPHVRAAPHREFPIVSICVPAFAGTNQTLASLAQVSGLVRHLVLADARPHGPQTRFLMAHLKASRPKAVIFGGWSHLYEPFLAARGAAPRWMVYWSSSTGQMQISGEVEKYVRVIGDRRIAAVLYADAHLARSAAAQLKVARYVPVCAPLPVHAPRRPPAARRGTTVLSLFFSPLETARKNPFTTLLALAGLQQPYLLYVNGWSRHPPYRTLLRQLAIRYRDFGWMRRDAYERRLAEVDLGLQVSLSESYSQVTADHLQRGIPVIVSQAVPVLGSLAPALRAKLVVTNADDPAALRAAIARLVARPRLRRRIGAALRRQFVIDNRARIRTARRALRTLT